MAEKNSRFISNLAYAFFAQFISFLLSILMSLIVPKILGVEEFSYWQLFMFYITYANFFHFGVNDGTYLRIGGKVYEELDFNQIGTEIKVAALFQSLILAGIVLYSTYIFNDVNRLFIILFSGIYIVIYNFVCYVGFVFQAVNQTKIFSISVIINKIAFILFILSLIFVKYDNFKLFVVFYVLSWVLSLIYLCVVGKKVVFCKRAGLLSTIKEMWIDITIGIKIMLASVASSLVLGFGRLIIDNVWGLTTFGKFSFAISLTNFALLFVMQASMVLFPQLRSSTENKQKNIYFFMRDGLSILLPVVLLSYIPIKIILSYWLPQYKESLQYLALLLPLCTFDGKMQLLCNTYFKVLRKEKILLAVNVLVMIISLVLNLIGAFLFKDIYLIIIFMVISVAIRSIISELYLAKLMESNIVFNIINECVLAAIFVVVSWKLSSTLSFITFFIAYLLFLCINRKTVKSFLFGLRRIRSNHL